MKRVSKEDLARATSPWAMKQTIQAERLHKAGNYAKALAKYENVMRRKPKCWPAVFNYSVLAHQMCQHAVAIDNLRRLLRYVPGCLEAWYNLGTIYQNTGQFNESVECLERVIEFDPDHGAALVNLGNGYLGLGLGDKAKDAYDRAAKATPDSPEALYNRAHYHLLHGEWEQGWRCYEARWSIPGFTEQNALTYLDGQRVPTPWQGESLAGCHLVVTGEQGWGDDIMCLRYAPRLRQLAKRVTWCVREGLVELARRTVAPDAVIPMTDPIPRADYIVTTMTLHERLKVTTDTVPSAGGYLEAA